MEDTPAEGWLLPIPDARRAAELRQVLGSAALPAEFLVLEPAHSVPFGTSPVLPLRPAAA